MLKHLATDTGNFVPARYSHGPNKAQNKAAERKYELDKKIVFDLKLQVADWGPTCTPYWKEYIRLASGGRIQVRSSLPAAQKLQFFLVKNGAEGFLPDKCERGRGDPRRTQGDPTTTPAKATFDEDSSHAILWNWLGERDAIPGVCGEAVPYDASNALVITDAAGTVVNYFQLLVKQGRRDFLDPGVTKKDDKGVVVENAVEGVSWDDKMVKMATPGYFRWDYPGLSVQDNDDYPADIHDFLGTHGCIQVCPYKPNGSFASDRLETEFASTYLKNWNKYRIPNVPKRDASGKVLLDPRDNRPILEENPDHPKTPVWLGKMRLVGF